MSSSSRPIPAHRFAEAIKDLPLANLHFKAAEIRNSIAHLESSNQQLQSFADDGDADCKEAVEENVEVIHRMEGRIELLKQEVEGRGFRWGEDEQTTASAIINGHGANDAGERRISPLAAATEQRSTLNGGSLSDEELAERLREQMEEAEDIDDDGVHL